jgi:AcrR family transcriptional regulator
MTAVPAEDLAAAQGSTDRRRRRTERTRAGIEAAALQLFAERGFEATTVEQIAEAADIAPRTFFRHFPSKDAVLFGDHARETARMRTVLAARPRDEHPMCSLAAAMLDAAERMEPDREQHLLRARLLDALEATGDYELFLLRQRWVQDVTDLLADRDGARTVHGSRAAAWTMVLMSCFGSAVHAWLVATDGTPLKRILAEVLEETAEGLAQAADTVETG